MRGGDQPLAKEHPHLQLRMGIHSGPVGGVVDVNEGANLAGAGLNIAHRVMDCGDAGHILLSKHVAADLEGYQKWRPLLHDLGSCEVKHGVRVSVVNLYDDQFGNAKLPLKFGTLAQTPQASARGGNRGGVACTCGNCRRHHNVFPLSSGISAGCAGKEHRCSSVRKPSRDPDNAYFADGIQEEILTRLAKIADLKVISRTSTQHDQSVPENLPEIARLLGVAHILEGSVQKSGDSVRVNVQLIKAANDSHLWADTFDRKLTDIFSVESEIAKAIADRLRAKLRVGKSKRSPPNRQTTLRLTMPTYVVWLTH